MKRKTSLALAMAGAVLGMALGPATAATVTFDSLLANPESWWNGSDGSGGFTSEGATFGNSYIADWDSWSGFAYSNLTGPASGDGLNQYLAVPGGGAGGSAGYAIGYLSSTVSYSSAVNMVNQGASITNNRYALDSMLNGDMFAKKFGGESGNDADWFLLTITGYLGGEEGATLEFYLADFRFEDNSLDYIVQDWEYVDFTGLGLVDELRFGFDSSDKNGPWLNTPTYFAIDNLPTVPEPSSFLLLTLAGGGWLARRRRN